MRPISRASNLYHGKKLQCGDVPLVDSKAMGKCCVESISPRLEVELHREPTMSQEAKVCKRANLLHSYEYLSMKALQLIQYRCSHRDIYRQRLVHTPLNPLS